MSPKAVVCVMLYHPTVYPHLTNYYNKLTAKKNFVILTIAYVI